MDNEERDKEILKQCIELAKQGIDLEKLTYEDIESFFEIVNEIMTLALKNYNFIKDKLER